MQKTLFFVLFPMAGHENGIYSMCKSIIMPLIIQRFHLDFLIKIKKMEHFNN